MVGKNEREGWLKQTSLHTWLKNTEVVLASYGANVNKQCERIGASVFVYSIQMAEWKKGNEYFKQLVNEENDKQTYCHA